MISLGMIACVCLEIVCLCCCLLRCLTLLAYVLVVRLVHSELWFGWFAMVCWRDLLLLVLKLFAIWFVFYDVGWFDSNLFCYGHFAWQLL